MPRPPRIQLAGVPIHIVQRGHNRSPCFFEAEDFEFYLHWLGVALQENECALHSYVLMDNHVHLLLTQAELGNCARLFMSLGRRFVHFVNTKYKRSGTLWESRYRSSLVQAESYLMRCHHYIEYNPVRANMVHDPASYRWSSYRANALGQRNPLITPHALYTGLASLPDARHLAYRDLCAQLLGEPEILTIRRALNHGKPLGNDSFRASVEELITENCEIRDRGRPRKDEK
ncbi:transposase [Pseudoduganella sp. LjRoot289]|uniref:transposase n=1 Tax=Pseudoduganella sp. LjRoot289 TaxID=3342314 RepID=UPI003ECEFCDB